MHCVVHYSEIALKGKNRFLFEDKLVENISRATSIKPKKERGRLVISGFDDAAALREKLGKVFGVAWFAFAEACPSEKEAILAAVLAVAVGNVENKAFKIDTNRAFKGFPLSSQQMNEVLGEKIVKEFGSTVSLKNPHLTIFVEIGEKNTYVFTEKIRGPGGLPVGTSGRVLLLLSGGIDSAAAAWLLMKRGCVVDFLHVHALPKNESVAESKIAKLFSALQRLSPDSRLFVVPFHEFDLAVQQLPPRYHLILFKRFILRLAEETAKKQNCAAIVLGDSLAQVASQTLQSIVVTDAAVNASVFRPLLGFDKQEIIDLAKKIGTFDLSIAEYKDCCAIVSKHPATQPKLEIVERLEKQIDIEKIVEKTLREVEELNHFHN